MMWPFRRNNKEEKRGWTFTINGRKFTKYFEGTPDQWKDEQARMLEKLSNFVKEELK